MEELRIGEVARRTDLTVKAIQYYERVGLIPRIVRGETGYRVFTEQHIRRLQQIKTLKALGLSLSAIRDIFPSAATAACACIDASSHLHGVLREQTKRIQQEVLRLVQLQEEVQRIVDYLESANRLPVELCSCSVTQSVELPVEKADVRGRNQPSLEPVEASSESPLVLPVLNWCGNGSCGCGCGPLAEL